MEEFTRGFFLDCSTLEEGTDKLPQNVSN